MFFSNVCFELDLYFQSISVIVSAFDSSASQVFHKALSAVKSIKSESEARCYRVTGMETRLKNKGYMDRKKTRFLGQLNFKLLSILWPLLPMY